MTRWQWFGAMTFGGAILLTLWLSSTIWAQQPRLEYPLPGPCSCVPNVLHFGHFEPTWRRWPGEERIEQINPHAPTSEVLRTPEGREIVPPPKATTPQQPPLGQPPQQQPPAREEGGLPLGAGGLILPTPGTNLPTTPGGSENKPGATKPSIEGELPGLGPEPEVGKPSTTTPSAKPPAPPEKAPGVNPPKSPEKPATSSMWENEPKSGTPFGVGAAYSTPPANARSDRRDVWRSNNRPFVRAVGGTKTDAVAVVAGKMEPERNVSLSGAYRADTIGVTTQSAGQVEPAAYAFAESSPKPAALDRPALPSVVLDGYCPVELSGSGRWVLGDLRWTVVHRGGIYRLSGAEQRRQFLANPDRFAPANSGNDAVLSATRNCSAPGKTAYCAIYDNRLYMFSSEATQAEFNRTPQLYAAKR
jgi:hypothetical protein